MRRILALSAALLALAACASRPRPASLVRPDPPPPVSAPTLDNYGRLLVPIGSTLLVEGDQTAYAPAPAGDRRSAPPINGVSDRRLPDAWPTVLARRLQRLVQVTEAVYPGDLASDGLSRWSTTPAADVTFIAYGLNEATREEDPLPPGDYFKAMQALASRARSHGGWVVLVVPPPYPDGDLDRSLAPYRDAVRSMAGQPRTLVFDPAPVLRATNKAWTGRRRISDAGQRALGEAMAGLLRLTARAG